MAVNYALVIKTRAGVPQRILTGQEGGFRWLSYKGETNGVGLLMFDLDAEHTAIDDLEEDGQVEAWRSDEANDVAWYADFEALFVDEERFASDDGDSTFRAICPGQMDFLARAVVAWPADTADRSFFTAQVASTVMTNLVTYNAVAASATVANGRIRTTDLANITCEADDTSGNTITFACAQQPLLEALQDVARIGDRDFYLVRTGAQAWQFRTDNYLGDNRADTVIFALNFGNMGNPKLKRNRLNEKTVMIVGGQGTEASRTFVTRTGTNYNATYNSKEAFYPATQYTTVAGLNAAGDVRLDETRARDDLTWDVIQTPGSMYGVHYFLGDLVTGYYQGVSATKQIISVTITFAPGNDRAETIAVETKTL
jgi:hypothetical protein